MKRHKQQSLAEETSRQMKKNKFKKSSSATTPLPLLKPSKYSPNQDPPSQQKQASCFPNLKELGRKGVRGHCASPPPLWAFLLLYQSRLKNLPSKQQPLLLPNVETKIEGTVSPATNYTPY